MPQQPEGEAPSPGSGEAVTRHVHSAAPEGPQQVGLSTGGNRRCVSCEVRNGIPVVHGETWSYYLSRLGGRRMVVLERRQNDRLRINNTTALVVLEIHPDQVKVAIEYSLNDPTKSQG